MSRSPITQRLRGAVALGFLLLAPTGLVAVQAAEAPVQAEKNPPGDIPDSQVFIVYTGAGFSMKVPEGWSRQDEANGARFFDKYNLIEATIADAKSNPTIASATANEAKQLTTSGRAVEITGVKEASLTGGKAIRIDYAENSEPNAVTNKQIRLERVRFLLFKAGKLVTLDMAAPLGADNVDQWALMANSLQLR
jgi:hypothetical protein